MREQWLSCAWCFTQIARMSLCMCVFRCFFCVFLYFLYFFCVCTCVLCFRVFTGGLVCSVRRQAVHVLAALAQTPQTTQTAQTATDAPSQTHAQTQTHALSQTHAQHAQTHARAQQQPLTSDAWFHLAETDPLSFLFDFERKQQQLLSARAVYARYLGRDTSYFEVTHIRVHTHTYT